MSSRHGRCSGKIRDDVLISDHAFSCHPLVPLPLSSLRRASSTARLLFTSLLLPSPSPHIISRTTTISSLPQGGRIRPLTTFVRRFAGSTGLWRSMEPGWRGLERRLESDGGGRFKEVGRDRRWLRRRSLEMDDLHRLYGMYVFFSRLRPKAVRGKEKNNKAQQMRGPRNRAEETSLFPSPLELALFSFLTLNTHLLHPKPTNSPHPPTPPSLTFLLQHVCPWPRVRLCISLSLCSSPLLTAGADLSLFFLADDELIPSRITPSSPSSPSRERLPSYVLSCLLSTYDQQQQQERDERETEGDGAELS